MDSEAKKDLAEGGTTGSKMRERGRSGGLEDVKKEERARGRRRGRGEGQGGGGGLSEE